MLSSVPGRGLQYPPPVVNAPHFTQGGKIITFMMRQMRKNQNIVCFDKPYSSFQSFWRQYIDILTDLLMGLALMLCEQWRFPVILQGFAVAAHQRSILSTQSRRLATEQR